MQFRLSVRFHISPKRTAPPKPNELISGKCAAVTPPNAITLASIMPACRAFCKLSVALPAGVFVSVLHHLHTSDIWNLRYGMLVVVLTYVIAYIVAFIMMKMLKVPKGRRGIFINMVVNDNCLFIGLPVQIALFGQEALPYFLLYYIGNTISVWMVAVFRLGHVLPYLLHEWRQLFFCLFHLLVKHNFYV